MKCPECSHDRSRAPSTNSQPAEHTLRKRLCEACGHVWFTAEVSVPTYAVGWQGSSGKPVLRAPLTVKAGRTQIGLSHEDAKDQMAGLQAWNEQKSNAADTRHCVTECD